MKIGIVQFDIAWEDKEENFRRIKKLIPERVDCDIIVLPEVFNTGFSMNPQVAEERGGKTERFLSGLASSLNTKVLAGYVVNSKGKLKNTAALFSEKGEKIASYSKIHLFSPLGEDKVFIRGNRTVLFKINKTPCSVFICYDLRFPEIFRKVAEKVKVIFLIANWPQSRAEHWKCLLMARAIENQCFVVGVNRVGEDLNAIRYSGDSIVFDPWGNEIFNAFNKEGFFELKLDTNRVKEIREKFPFLKDRRF